MRSLARVAFRVELCKLTPEDKAIVIMSQQSFEEFRRVVLADLALQQRLQRENDFQALARLVVELGRERGFVLTREDVETARRSSQRAWLERWL